MTLELIEVEVDPNYVVVKRALVSLKIGKPEDMSDQEFDENMDRMYVLLSDVVDARAIHANLNAMLAISLPGVNLPTAVDVL